MGVFLDYLTGGNGKVTANLVADIFFKINDYWKTIYIFRELMIKKGKNERLNDFSDLLYGHKMNNLTVLCAIDLNVFAGPPNTSLHDTMSWVYKDVEKQLRKRGVPEIYITGDNSH